MRLVVPEEDVAILLRESEGIFDEGLEERSILGIGLVVVGRAAVLRLVADSLVVRESDVVRRIGVYHVGKVSVHELLHDLRVEGASADEAVPAEGIDVASLDIRFLRFLQFFFFVEIIVGHFERVVEDVC